MSTSTQAQQQNPNQAQGLDITTLPTAQLSQLQARISSELEHLSTSHARLRAAQTRFKDCIRAIADGVENKPANTPLLIPLTSSLYVPARPNARKPNTVLVDVGTGYYVEKTTTDATRFYEGKIDDLRRSLADVERVVGAKSADLRGVEDVLRARVLAEQSAAGGQAQGQAQADAQKGKGKSKSGS